MLKSLIHLIQLIVRHPDQEIWLRINLRGTHLLASIYPSQRIGRTTGCCKHPHGCLNKNIDSLALALGFRDTVPYLFKFCLGYTDVSSFDCCMYGINNVIHLFK